YLGEISWDHSFYPISFFDWRRVPTEIKDKAWETLFLPNLYVDEAGMPTVRLYCEGIICEIWKKHKLQLYKDYFEKLSEKTDVEKKAAPPQGVTLQDWTKLVEHMNTPETKLLTKNKDNINSSKIHHRGGACSHKRWKKDYEAKHGVKASRGTMFLHLHKREDEYKKDANETAAMGVAGLDSTEPSEDDAYVVARNKAEHLGRVCGCGYGATPSLVDPSSADEHY
ncbi:hypothetical protein LINGRAHAP2_LOCUS34951, partial [Linum grandiflorum]